MNETLNARTGSMTAMSSTAKTVLGGLAVATAASFLPWEQDTGPFGAQIAATPADTGTLAYLIVLIAATAWVAWPAVSNVLTAKRRVLLAVFAAALTFFAWAKFQGLSEAQAKIDSAQTTDLLSSFTGAETMAKYGPGLGLFVFCGAMVAVWIGVIRAALTPRLAVAARPAVGFPPPDVSALRPQGC